MGSGSEGSVGSLWIRLGFGGFGGVSEGSIRGQLVVDASLTPLISVSSYAPLADTLSSCIGIKKKVYLLI